MWYGWWEEGGRGEREGVGVYLFQIHGAHGAFHAFYDAGHGAGDLAHGDGCLDPGCDGVDAAAESEEVEFLVLLTDGILGVYLGYVGVVLLDSLLGERKKLLAGRAGRVEKAKVIGEKGYTFLSLFFSAVSSLPAFAACRFSCLAVNFRLKSDFSRPDIVDGVRGRGGGVGGFLRMGMLRLEQLMLKRESKYGDCSGFL